MAVQTGSFNIRTNDESFSILPIPLLFIGLLSTGIVLLKEDRLTVYIKYLDCIWQLDHFSYER
jgi:hypothetical protein